jgi:hypothetical protein
MGKPDSIFKEAFRQAKQDTSSEIFASFTINKIDKDVLATMTPEQVNAIRDALIASNRSQRHALDFRGSFSLYFAHYYFVFFAGRDRRRQTLLKEAIRNNRGNKQFGLAFTYLGLLFGLLILGIIGFFTAYWIKSEMGIDINPDKHLEDILKEIFF